MTTSRTVVLSAYNDNLLRAMLALKVEERPIPSFQTDEVLVKMEGAPCNPSDIAFLRGGYNILKPLPAVPGFEGAGTVVEAGREAKELLGKRVSCFVQGNNMGTWAEYFVASKNDCMVIKEGIDWMQAACLSINPMTAWALYEKVRKAGCKAFIQNAGGGQVPRIMEALAEKNGMAVISLVRKRTPAVSANSQGMKHVLSTGDDHFEEFFSNLCRELKPGFAFDAVGGDLAGKMLNAMPDGSELVVYGGLSGEFLSGIDPMGIIFRKKSVTGFNLNNWLAEKTAEKLEASRELIQDLIIRREIEIHIRGTFRIEEVVTGLRTYIKSMSEGKIIFTP